MCSRIMATTLQHNFGHGEQHLSTVLFSLNLLAFLIHTAQHLTNDAYRLLRETLAVRRTFFNDLKALTRYIVFDSWDALFSFMLDGLELSIPPPNPAQQSQNENCCKDHSYFLPKDDYFERGVAAALLGLTYWASGDLEAAARTFADGLANMRTAGNVLATISGTFVLAGIKMAQGPSPRSSKYIRAVIAACDGAW